MANTKEQTDTLYLIQAPTSTYGGDRRKKHDWREVRRDWKTIDITSDYSLIEEYITGIYTDYDDETGESHTVQSEPLPIYRVFELKSSQGNLISPSDLLWKLRYQKMEGKLSEEEFLEQEEMLRQLSESTQGIIPDFFDGTARKEFSIAQGDLEIEY